MKDKEKQIEEIAKVIESTELDWYVNEGESVQDWIKMHAEKLYEQGYRKLPKDSVVLSKEEYQKNILKANSDGYGAGKIEARKETAEKCRNFVKKWAGNSEEGLGFLFDFEDFIAKQFGVEIKE